jgi:tripartite-type tricarboxylate transporter receptor subunit TctC
MRKSNNVPPPNAPYLPGTAPSGVVTPETLSPIGGDIGIAISSSRSTRTTGMLTLRRRSRIYSAAALFVSASALAATLAIPTPARAQSVAEFFTGKTINIYVGYSPGGSYDYYPRVFARHMGKYIPGHPNVVVQNMPGAGSLRAANYLYNVAPKDGTALGVVTQTVMLEAPLGTPGVKYNAVEFTYIGRMTGVLETMISWHEAPAKSIQEVRKHEMIAGGTGPTSPTEGYPRLLNAFAGTKFRIVSGFGGTSEIMLAMERREVDALENSWNSIVRTKKEWVDTKKINVLIQAVMQRSRELPDTPTLVEMGETPEARAALAFYTSAAEVSRSLLGAPGIPADRLKALREAFQAVTRDPEFLAEIKKSQSEFDPAPGEYLEDLAKKIAATPPEIVRRTADALRAK